MNRIGHSQFTARPKNRATTPILQLRMAAVAVALTAFGLLTACGGGSDSGPADATATSTTAVSSSGSDTSTTTAVDTSTAASTGAATSTETGRTELIAEAATAHSANDTAIHPSPKLAPGTTVSLKSMANGDYVTADDAGAKPLIAKPKAIGPWEEFQVEDAGGGNIALKSLANNLYVSADDAGASPLIANRTAVGPWETFTEIPEANGEISLRAKANGKYVTADNAGASPLIANRSSVGTWETFGVTAQTSTTAAVLTLPLEVLGDGSPRTPVIAEAKLGVEAGKLGSVAQLWFQCHRCGFFGAPEFEAVSALPMKIKASMRVLGGASDANAASIPWIDITDENVKLPDVERLQGGLNDGGFYTTRITVPLDDTTRARLVALPSYNRIEFRFNGTDGQSNGFRILKLQLQDSAATDVGSTTTKQFDPTTERDVTALSADDVAEGKVLWQSRGILSKSSIVPRKLNAACSSCHAANGRDLQYFNYSNNAIVQRSRFHGLNETQGKQIVAYLRSSLKDVPYVAKAAPWNPPYQPGPGLDCSTASCATQWSAGAGIDAVLTTSQQAMQALFGKSVDTVTQADIDKVMDPTATLNVRETAIPLQFPDWNAWLPADHPFDIWPVGASNTGSFQAGATFANGKHDPYGKYLALIAWLKANANPNGNIADWSHLTPDQRTEIMALFTGAGWAAADFDGGGRGWHIAPTGQYGAQVGAAHLQSLANSATVAAGKAGAFTTNSFIERAVTDTMHWNAVKQWELAQDFWLEGNQKWFIGTKDPTSGAWKGRGEAHGWPFNSVSLFSLAPHIDYQADTDSAGRVTREVYRAWEADNQIGSHYQTNQWYQLQLTLNSGAKSGIHNYPMDWPYLTAFDAGLAQMVGSATATAKAVASPSYVRLLEGKIKAAQHVNTDTVLYDPKIPLISNPGRLSRANFIIILNATDTMPLEMLHTESNKKEMRASINAFMDDLSPGLSLKVLNGTIHMNNLLYTDTEPSAWRRCDPTNMELLGSSESYTHWRFCLDKTRIPLGKNPDASYYVHRTPNGWTTVESQEYGVWKATQLGAEPVRLKKWSDWVNKAWPVK